MCWSRSVLRCGCYGYVLGARRRRPYRFVPAYAPPTPCPVLAEVRQLASLRVSYAVSGADDLRKYEEAWRVVGEVLPYTISLPHRPTSLPYAISLHAMSSTEVAYAAMRCTVRGVQYWGSVCCYAVCSTGVAYVATRCAVLSKGMLLPGYGCDPADRNHPYGASMPSRQSPVQAYRMVPAYLFPYRERGGTTITMRNAVLSSGMVLRVLCDTSTELGYGATSAMRYAVLSSGMVLPGKLGRARYAALCP
eukprot:3174890-Rhodomonas_salina.1